MSHYNDFLLKHQTNVFNFSLPLAPMFEMTTYTVPENNRSVPLCIFLGVHFSINITYNISAQQMKLSQAEGV